MAKKIRNSAGAIFFALVILAQHFDIVLAQQENIHIAQLDYSNFPDFNLYISVVDKFGEPISGLTVDNFMLSEDDRLQKIISATPALELPESDFSHLYVALVLDNSESIKPFANLVKKAATSFIDNLRKGDKAAIIIFEVDESRVPLRARIVEPFTDVKFSLKHRIQFPYFTNRTYLFDAIYRACQTLEHEETLGRKAIVVLSDGQDIGSKVSLKDVLTQAIKTEIPIYAIDFSQGAYAHVLNQMASETGGKYYRSRDPNDLLTVYAAIIKQLQGQYRISYTTQNENWRQASRKVTLAVTMQDAVFASSRQFEMDRDRMGYLNILYQEKTATISEADYKTYLAEFASSEWNDDVQFKLGVFYEERGFYDQALEIYNKLGDLPQIEWRDDVWFRKGKIYADRGNHEKAVDAYQQVVNQFPNEKNADQALLGLARSFIELNKTSEAESAYRKMVTEYPGSSFCDEALLELSDLKLAQGDYRVAQATLLELVQKYPDSNCAVHAQYNLATIYETEGNIEQALACCDRSLSATDDRNLKVRAQQKKAAIYFSTQNWEQALNVFNSILQDYEDLGYGDEAICGMCKTYRELKDYRNMRHQFRALEEMRDRGEAVSFDLDEINSIKKVIPPYQGGVVSTLSGAQLEIPPDTLAFPVEITIKSMPTPESAWNFPVIGKVYDIGASIDTFFTSVKLALPYEESWFEDTTKIRNELSLYSYEHGQWTPIPNSQLDTVRQVVFAEVNHLSWKTLMYRKPLVLRFEDILFEFNKATLSPYALFQLDTVLTLLKTSSEIRVEVAGHTDSVGTEEYNLNLSRKRAESIKEFLLERGIAEERIVARGYGEKFPLSSNSTEEGRQRNRRTEFIVLAKGEGIIVDMPQRQYPVKYVLELGKFQHITKAYEQRDFFRKQGYEVIVVEHQQEDQRYYRVWLGAFDSKEEAENFATSLIEKYQNVSYSIVEKW